MGLNGNWKRSDDGTSRLETHFSSIELRKSVNGWVAYLTIMEIGQIELYLGFWSLDTADKRESRAESLIGSVARDLVKNLPNTRKEAIDNDVYDKTDPWYDEYFQAKKSCKSLK